MGSFLPTTAPPLQVSRELLEASALKLRAEGKTYQQIADELGVGINTASRYVKAALERLREESSEAAQEVRDLEEMRLDRMLSSVAQNAFTGDLKAIETVLKLMERRAKLRGTDAPEKSLSVSVLAGGTQSELEAEARKLGLPIPVPPLTSQLPGLGGVSDGVRPTEGPDSVHGGPPEEREVHDSGPPGLEGAGPSSCLSGRLPPGPLSPAIHPSNGAADSRDGRGYRPGSLSEELHGHRGRDEPDRLGPSEVVLD